MLSRVLYGTIDSCGAWAKLLWHPMNTQCKTRCPWSRTFFRRSTLRWTSFKKENSVLAWNESLDNKVATFQICHPNMSVRINLRSNVPSKNGGQYVFWQMLFLIVQHIAKNAHLLQGPNHEEASPTASVQCTWRLPAANCLRLCLWGKHFVPANQLFA